MGLGILRHIFASVCGAAVVSSALAAAATNEVSVFADRNLEDAVREQVFSKRDSKAPLTATDVATVSTVVAHNRGITNLAGLNYCKALALADFAGNKIVDLSPMADLKQLQSLTLTSNLVSDVKPLGTVSALQYIELSHNQVQDIAALGKLTHLTSLYLSYNKLNGLGAATNLPRLATLYVDGNNIKSIAGVQNLKGLTLFSVAHNSVSEVDALSGLVEPSFVILAHNRIRDIEPFYKALTNDLAGSQRYAPFARIYLQDNPLSRKSKKLAEELKAKGVRIDPDPIP